MSKQKQLDLKTDGVVKAGKLNEVIYKVTRRPNGTLRIQQDFEFCPTLAEQHTGHLTDLNYLIEKYKPDELAAYIAARNQYRQEILGHDFSRELTLQDAKNSVLAARQIFDAMPEDIQLQFKSPLEFIKFLDNPKNAQKMHSLGLISDQELASVIGPTAVPAQPSTTTPTTQEEKKEEKK